MAENKTLLCPVFRTAGVLCWESDIFLLGLGLAFTHSATENPFSSSKRKRKHHSSHSNAQKTCESVIHTMLLS
jgi:hypothetical protein